MRNSIPVITIDGPSGTGKGTVSGNLVQWLHWHFLDSGALYRVLALAAKYRGMGLEDTAALAEIANHLDVEFTPPGPGKEVSVCLDGKCVDGELRTEACGNDASKIAAYPAVRAGLLSRQRQFRQAPGLIADGRDMGTVVFPDAAVKIFLTASAEERAMRRYKQLKQKGFDVNLPQLSADIAERDARDSERTISPLKPADDAVVIDTTSIDIRAVVEKVASLVKQKIPQTAEIPMQ